MPWLDLLGLNVMAGATVLGVPVKQMLTTENDAGQVKSGEGEVKKLKTENCSTKCKYRELANLEWNSHHL